MLRRRRSAGAGHAERGSGHRAGVQLSRSRRRARGGGAPAESASARHGRAASSHRARRPPPAAVSLSRARRVRRTRACRSKRSTRCRWRPSRMRPRSISRSTRWRRTSRARRSWRCCDRRIFSFGPVDEVATASVAALDFALAEARYLGGLERLEELARRWAADRRPGVSRASAARRRQRRRPLRSRTPCEGWRRLPANGPSRRRSRRSSRGCGASIGRPQRGRRHAIAAVARARGRSRRAGLAGGSVPRTRSWRGGRRHARLTPRFAAGLAARRLRCRQGRQACRSSTRRPPAYGEFDDVQLVGLIDGEWPERFRRNVLYPVVAPGAARAAAGRRRSRPPRARRAQRGARGVQGSAAAAARAPACCRRSCSKTTPSSSRRSCWTRSRPLRLVQRICRGGADSRRPAPKRWRSSRESPHVLPASVRPWARRASRSRARARRHGFTARRAPGRCRACRSAGSSAISIVRSASSRPRCSGSRNSRKTKTRGRRSSADASCTSCSSASSPNGSSEVIAGSTRQRSAKRAQLFESICEEALADVVAGGSRAGAHAPARIGGEPGHRASRVRDGGRAADARSSSGCSSFRLQGDFRFEAPDGRRANRDAEREDRSHRPARRRHAARHRLQIEEDAGSESGAAAADLQPVRARPRSRATPIAVGRSPKRSMCRSRARKPSCPSDRRRDAASTMLLDDAQDRLLTTLDRIAEGHFPPQPQKKSLCGFCPYASVCRLEYVEEPGALVASLATRRRSLAEARSRLLASGGGR